MKKRKNKTKNFFKKKFKNDENDEIINENEIINNNNNNNLNNNLNNNNIITSSTFKYIKEIAEKNIELNKNKFIIEKNFQFNSNKISTFNLLKFFDSFSNFIVEIRQILSKNLINFEFENFNKDFIFQINYDKNLNKLFYFPEKIPIKKLNDEEKNIFLNELEIPSNYFFDFLNCINIINNKI
jgi:hypothetical protein